MYDLLISNVILNGKVFDVAIEKGRITSVGGLEMCEAKRKIDAGKKLAAFPPFYNMHSHAAMTLLRSYAEDLELFEWLSKHIWPCEDKLTEEDIYVGTRLAALEMIRSGTVYFNDSYWFPEASLRAVRESGMRATLGLLYICNGNGDVLEKNQVANERLLAAAADDSGKIRVAHTPHAIYTVGEKVLRSIVKAMENDGMQVHIHVAETAKEVEDCRKEHNGMTPVEYLDSIGMISDRAILAHCVHLTDHDREIIASRGAWIAHNPVSNIKLCSGFFDYGAAVKAGCRVTLGTDGCASNNNLSMFDEMKAAALTAKICGKTPTAGKTSDIFQMATAAGTEFAIGKDQGGVIAPGKVADLMLIDLDHPLLCSGYDLVADMVYAGEAQMVDTLICGGEVLMEHRIIPQEAEIVEAARKVCRKIAAMR